MPEPLLYRKVSVFEFPPVYTSLGIDRSAFRNTHERRTKIFDAAANVGSDTLFLFKENKYCRYNLSDKRFESEDLKIDGGEAPLPHIFSTGIDSVWPDTLLGDQGLRMVRGDKMIFTGLVNGFWYAAGPTVNVIDVFPVAQGNWLANGCDAALRDQIDGTVLHLFGGTGEYMRIKGRDELLIPPMPLSEQFNLPEPFASSIDLAFYDQGQAVFFSGDVCADFDLLDNVLVGVQRIERRFPAFAKYLSRPQVFLVENYVLETYVGPLSLGRLVNTRTVLPGSTEKVIIVTERVSAAQTTLIQTVLESQNEEVVRDFNDRVDKETQQSDGFETYRYQMDADFQGEASATSLWGGEVNAQLGVSGGTDSSRKSFADAAFKSVTSQVRTVSESFEQKAYSVGETIENLERVINKQEFSLEGDPEITRTFSFHQRLEPYYALLVLKDVRIAYGDGSGTRPVPVALSALPGLLEEKLASQDDQAQLLEYLRTELSAIADQRGQATTIFASAAPGDLIFDLKPNPTATFEIQLPDGQTQAIVVRGLLIKGDKEVLYQTTNVFPVKSEQ